MAADESGADGPLTASAARGQRLPIPSEFRSRVRYDEPMAAHSSWHSGGSADSYFVPRDADEVCRFLRELPLAVPVYWVGLGTNLLVREGGLRGVVIATAGLGRIERQEDARIHAEAGVPCPRIARCCVNWQLAHGEFFGGIPGTLGGALAMNAGAFGDETWRHVRHVVTVDRQGVRRDRSADDYRIGYRNVALASGDTSSEWFIAAQLQFEASSGEVANATTPRELMQRRRATQPLGLWSCGSVFKNPPGEHAARLIEAAGLKGYRIGDALVSDKHANFIINSHAARPSELEQLIEHVRDTVQRVHGVTLEPEVRIVGERAAPAEDA